MSWEIIIHVHKEYTWFQIRTASNGLLEVKNQDFGYKELRYSLKGCPGFTQIAARTEDLNLATEFVNFVKGTFKHET